ncbi:MAG: SPOR domain-containing protein [Bacteroidaceae bacterium]|nr:SPOR domain-containing protein [Bacteroidaceae bacterium]
MKILTRHIETLMLEHDCVIVQGLGGFIANQKPAHYNATENMFAPPYRAVMFNQQLQESDGLLTQSYMQTFDAAYPEALCQLEKDVDQLCQNLDTNGEVQIGNLGTLKKDLSGRIWLEPQEASILTPWYYGLTPLSIKPVAQLETEAEKARIVPIRQEEPEQQANEQTLLPTGTEGMPAKKRPMLMDFGIAAAVAALIFLLFSAPTLHSPRVAEDYCIAGTLMTTPPSHAAQSALAQTTEAPAAQQEAQQQTDNAQSENAAPQHPAGNYTLVLACYVSEKNARLFISHLSEAGYKDAEFVDGKVTRILYGQYATEEEAASSLRQLRKENANFSQAWVMENKSRKV